MKTIIYFVRHGKVNNPKNVWYGRLPGFALSEFGKLQIEKTAEFLSDKHIDFIYSSPLLRAKQTAVIIKNKLNLPSVHFSKNLLEVKSSLAGKPFSYIDSIQSNVFASPDNKITGETIEELEERMQKFTSYVTKKHPGKRIVVVGHGDPIMIIKAKNQGLGITNSSIHTNKKDYIKHGQVYRIFVKLSATSSQLKS